MTEFLKKIFIPQLEFEGANDVEKFANSKKISWSKNTKSNAMWQKGE